MSDREAMKLAMLDIERNAHLLGVTQAEQQILGNTPLRTTTAADCYYRLRVRKDELRAHLAAPEPTHPGYILGSHWLETAYSRICAGEAEAEVLRDCGWERVNDAEALRRDAERYRWLRDTFTVAKGGATVTFNEELGNYETPIAGTEVSLQWYPETPIGSYHVEASTLNAAIDAAMENKI